jgi:Flp pilus assembly protein TadG
MYRLTNIFRPLHRLAGEEDGAMAVIVALLIPLMVGMVAMVEASGAYLLKNRLQTTADAAAMAAVHQVPVAADVTSTALDFAHRNMPADGHYGDVLLAEDAEMGHWNSGSRVFTPEGEPGGGPANAVRVVTRGELTLFFGAALRALNPSFGDMPASLQPVARAIALIRLDKCYLNGFVAGGVVQMNSSNTFKSGFCVYGRGGVSMNSSNTFEPGTGVGMLSLSDLDAGTNNPGLQEALLQKDLAAPAAGEANQLIDDLLAGTGPIPSYITRTESVSTLPASPVPGTMYIHTGTSSVELSGTVQNIGVVSQQAIIIRSNSNLRSVVLASRQSVNIRANVKIGDADYCTTKAGGSLIVSGGAVSDKDVPVGTNSNIHLHGVQVVSGGRIEMNSNLTITAASMQATADIKFNSQFDVAGCADETSPNATGTGTLVSKLVD